MHILHVTNPSLKTLYIFKQRLATFLTRSYIQLPVGEVLSSPEPSASAPLPPPPFFFSLFLAALHDFEHVVTSSQHRSHFFRHVNGR